MPDCEVVNTGSVAKVEIGLLKATGFYRIENIGNIVQLRPGIEKLVLYIRGKIPTYIAIIFQGILKR